MKAVPWGRTASIHALAGTGEDDSIAAEALLALRNHPEPERE